MNESAVNSTPEPTMSGLKEALSHPISPYGNINPGKKKKTKTSRNNSMIDISKEPISQNLDNWSSNHAHFTNQEISLLSGFIYAQSVSLIYWTDQSVSLI